MFLNEQKRICVFVPMCIRFAGAVYTIVSGSVSKEKSHSNSFDGEMHFPQMYSTIEKSCCRVYTLIQRHTYKDKNTLYTETHSCIIHSLQFARTCTSCIACIDTAIDQGRRSLRGKSLGTRREYTFDLCSPYVGNKGIVERPSQALSSHSANSATRTATR